MSLADYQITVIDPASGQVNQIYDGTALYEMRYNRPLNDIGALALTLPVQGNALRLRSIFSLDALIEVARTSPTTGQLQVEDTFLTRLTHRFREGDEERFVVGGLSLNHLLARRVIDPDDDPLAAGGYSTKAGPADDVMRAYAREQCGDLCLTAARQFPNFSVGPVGSIGAGVGKRARYENLFELFQELSRSGNMDFIVRRISGNTLRLTIAPIGTDKSVTTNYPFAPSVMLNPDRGNLANPSLLIDRKKESNFCYALGQGQGEFRIVAKVTGLGLGDSPYNRLEFTEDVRLAERNQNQQLLTGARDALKERQPIREFTFEPTGQQPGNIYRDDWDIGDLVTAAWDDESLDLRIRDVELDISQSGENISVTMEPV
jgi:hypothetical protein